MKNTKSIKKGLNPKQKEILYCLFLIIIITIIAFGDQIILKFISHHPNPSDRVFGEQETINKEYDIPFLEELTVEEIVDKIEKKDTFILFSSRKSCMTCVSMIQDIEELLGKYDSFIYFVNQEIITKDSDSYQKWIKDDKELKKNLSYTPFLMYYRNGVLENSVVGKTTKEELEQFIIHYNKY